MSKENGKYFILLEDRMAFKKDAKIRVLKGSLWIIESLLGKTLVSADNKDILLVHDSKNLQALDTPLYLMLLAINVPFQRWFTFCFRPKFLERALLIYQRFKKHDCAHKNCILAGAKVDFCPSPSGYLKYIGKVAGLQGIWFGVELHEPNEALCNSTGFHMGELLFKCTRNCGILVTVNNLLEISDLASFKDYGDDFSEGDRVMVFLEAERFERGIIRWIGKLERNHKQPSYGIEFDNPVGKGTGKYQGKTLYRTKPLHAGLFPAEALIKSLGVGNLQNTGVLLPYTHPEDLLQKAHEDHYAQNHSLEQIKQQLNQQVPSFHQLRMDRHRYKSKTTKKNFKNEKHATRSNEQHQTSGSFDQFLSASTLQPSTLQPSTLQPSTLQPSTLQPSTLQPSTLQPSTLQPPTLQPSTLQPPTLQPSTLQPSTLQPSTLQPSTLQPSTLQAPTLQPSTLQPPTLQPSTLQPSTLQPSTLQPSTLQPPTLQPSTLQPSTLQPPTLQPPTLQPPTLQPSTLQPSTLQPLAPSSKVTKALSSRAAMNSVVRVKVPGLREPQRGILRWRGQLEKEYFFGVQLEHECSAATDGSFCGKELFKCPAKKGYFTSKILLETGIAALAAEENEDGEEKEKKEKEKKEKEKKDKEEEKEEKEEEKKEREKEIEEKEKEKRKDKNDCGNEKIFHEKKEEKEGVNIVVTENRSKVPAVDRLLWGSFEDEVERCLKAENLTELILLLENANSSKVDKPFPAYIYNKVSFETGSCLGIQGYTNSCYLDTVLFSMFAFNHSFDSLLQRTEKLDHLLDHDKILNTLVRDIVNPLRRNVFVHWSNVFKLRKYIERNSLDQGYTSSKKDPEELLLCLFRDILKVEPFNRFDSGLDDYLFQLITDINMVTPVPSTEYLFAYSMKAFNTKFANSPDNLILQIPRYGKEKVLNNIVPSPYLDINSFVTGREGKSTNLTARTDAEKSPSLGTNTANNKDNNNARNNKNTENTGNKNKIKNENTNTESDSNATVSTQEEDEGLKWSNKLIGNLVLKKLKRPVKRHKKPVMRMRGHTDSYARKDSCGEKKEEENEKIKKDQVSKTIAHTFSLKGELNRYFLTSSAPNIQSTISADRWTLKTASRNLTYSIDSFCLEDWNDSGSENSADGNGYNRKDSKRGDSNKTEGNNNNNNKEDDFRSGLLSGDEGVDCYLSRDSSTSLEKASSLETRKSVANEMESVKERSAKGTIQFSEIKNGTTDNIDKVKLKGGNETQSSEVRDNKKFEKHINFAKTKKIGWFGRKGKKEEEEKKEEREEKEEKKDEKKKEEKEKNKKEEKDKKEEREEKEEEACWMELHSVICIDWSHYVSFVKTGTSHEAPWVFFDSMAEREDVEEGYNIPRLRHCQGISEFLLRNSKKKDALEFRGLTSELTRLLQDTYICFYRKITF